MENNKKHILVLGCTGSIGKNTLDVVRAYPNRFSIQAVSAHTREKELIAIADEFKVPALCLTGKKPENSRIKYHGNQGLSEMISRCSCAVAINGISGSSGLLPSIEIIKNGIDLGLANKETLVMAGPLIRKLASENNVNLVPVDSEHSAIFHLLKKTALKDVDEIILTASGGAFRNWDIEQLKTVTLENALTHPNWDMGPKITIDSATMANKGLEVIEAWRLFDIPPEKIRVIIHPQSIIHSMVRTIDSAVYAHMSEPDMSLPIINALTYPELAASSFGKLDFAGKTLTFEKPSRPKYPALFAAFDVIQKGSSWPIAYNALNEEAVSAFTRGDISFLDISRVLSLGLRLDWSMQTDSINDILETDNKARKAAASIISELGDN